ncbi:MerR family transcriptional regulator [Streptomyces sp. NPDC005953]|uniref:MerR family transcriptional regulator n=1 Tax=Streptomyces sp. NPDC005953 TaxID=3156719 RepID=UPI0033F8F1C4
MGKRGLRPVDLAREHGLSTQAVRNYEDEGILPPAERTAHGYRIYTRLHAQALRTFIALIPGHGHQQAAQILRELNDGDLDAALTLVDDTHGQLRQDRATLAAVEAALVDLTSTDPAPQHGPGHGPQHGPGHGPKHSPGHGPGYSRKHGPEGTDSFIGPLARQLSVRPATLRAWERVGLVRPSRDRATGYRTYTASDVRDAHLVRQLRRGGYPLEHIAPLLEQVRNAGGVEALEAALHDWHERLTRRRLALLTSAAELSAYVELAGPFPGSPPGRAPDEEPNT